MVQDNRIGIICDDSGLKLELSAQLRLLGERLEDPARAHGVFVVAGSDYTPSAIQGRPAVLCVPSIDGTPREQGPDAQISKQVIARLTIPATKLQLELAVAQMHKHLRGQSGANSELLPEIVGNSATIHELRRQINQVTVGESTVLLTGPSGTGKSFLAETIHRHSSRAAGPFVPVNCGAIPEELIESELFGHEKGAFTGAVEQRAGRFELAAGGTLFLDEIGDMPFAMQVKLLRAIQERVFERVGGVTTLSANVRIIAATNVNLEERIQAGLFREDLYYRINVFPVAVPPLADRSDDLPALIAHFQKDVQAQYGYAVRFTGDAVEKLQDYAWPGNLRELRNLIERLTVEHGDNLLSADSLPARYLRSTEQRVEPVVSEVTDNGLLPINGIDLKAHLAELEQRLIEQALRDSDAVVARAADRLHIRRTTLVEKMRKYGIDRATH